MLPNASEPFGGGMEVFCETANSTEKYGEDDRMKTLDWIAYQIIGPMVVVIGLLGNVLNLIVLTRPSFKGVTYTYLIGLACSDLGVLLCAVAMMIRQVGYYPSDSWLASLFYAHMEIPLSNIFMASSIYIVVCLTVDRFASVCTPTKFKSVHTSQIAKTAILVCYILAIIISIPLVLLKKICPLEDTSAGYNFRENRHVTLTMIWKVYSVSAEVLVRFGPLLILTILNAMIIRRFRQITEKRREMRRAGETLCRTEEFLLKGEKISKKIYKEEKRLVVLLMSIVLLFFVTTTPVAFLNIFYTEDLNDNFYFQVFRAMANDLELCNFALNFYIYFLCSKEFRKKFLSFFQFLIPHKAKSDFQSITLPEVSHHKTLVNNKVIHDV